VPLAVPQPVDPVAQSAAASAPASAPAGTPEPQPVLTPLTAAAIFLVATVEPGGEQTVREVLGGLAGITRSVGFREQSGGLTCVAGIGSQAWDRLLSGPPGDLLFHIRARRMDLCFELAGQLVRQLGDAVRVVDEVHGFKYFDERDLMGFVDGTENPTGPAAVTAAHVTAGSDPAFAGGSYVVVQKYLHDLDAWNRLPVEEQERVIGRTKLDNIELSDEAKPADSHVALNTIVDEDGAERQIVRDNMPFGRVGAGEFGTYFIGYAASPEVTEQMLRRMFLGDVPGRTDRILEFSTAVTGALFFCPSADFLEDLPEPPGAATNAAATTPVIPSPTPPNQPATSSPAAADAATAGPADTAVPGADGSLGIGSLRRSLAP